MWTSLSIPEKQQLENIQFKVNNGPENSGRRRQFLKRMVEFADQTKKSIQVLYVPPYHSKYNPIERCWGILERHWTEHF
nr:transposase [Crocosphaera watsonii]